MKKMIPNILAAVAILNLIWLFGAEYRLPSFLTRPAGKEQQAEEAPSAEEEETLQGENPGENAPAAVPAEAEETEDAGEAEEPGGEEKEKTCRPSEGNTPNIRSGPGQDYDVIGMVQEGEVLTVRGEEEEGWLPIRTKEGLEGYVFADLLVMEEDLQ